MTKLVESKLNADRRVGLFVVTTAVIVAIGAIAEGSGTRLSLAAVVALVSAAVVAALVDGHIATMYEAVGKLLLSPIRATMGHSTRVVAGPVQKESPEKRHGQLGFALICGSIASVATIATMTAWRANTDQPQAQRDAVAREEIRSRVAALRAEKLQLETRGVRPAAIQGADGRLVIVADLSRADGREKLQQAVERIQKACIQASAADASKGGSAAPDPSCGQIVVMGADALRNTPAMAALGEEAQALARERSALR